MDQANVQSVLTAATRMAASGDYRSATVLLDQLDGADPPVPALLLRAKIAAQQGDFDQALTHWRSVLAREPANAEAADGVAAVRAARQAPPRGTGHRSSAALRTAGAVLLLLAGVLLGRTVLNSHATIPAALLTRLDALESQATGLARQGTDLQATANAIAQGQRDAMAGQREMAREVTGNVSVELTRTALGQQAEVRGAQAALSTYVSDQTKQIDARLDGLARDITAHEKASDQRLTALESRLIASQDEQVRILRTRIERAQEDLATRVETIGSDLYVYLGMADRMRQFAQSWQHVERKFWGANAKDLKSLRQRLEDVAGQMEALQAKAGVQTRPAAASQ